MRTTLPTRKPSPATARHYAVAVGLIALALLLSLLLRPLAEPNPFLFFIAAVAVAAWYGGLGPGVLATVLTVGAAHVVFLQPQDPLTLGLSAALRLGAFTLVAVLISSLSAARWRADTARAALLADEQRARLAAERLAERLSRLQQLTASLAAALQPADVARVITEQCRLALGAPASAVMLLDADRGMLELLHDVGYGEAFRGWGRFSIDTPFPLSEAVRTATPIYLASRAELAARYPDLVSAPTIAAAVAYLPLLADGRPIGGMSVTFDDARALETEQRAFLETVASHCAQALDRARLYAAERQTRERLAFLTEASTHLAHSLDYQATLAEITRLCVPRLADWCAVETPGASGELALEIIAHVDPAREQWARELRARFPGRMDMPVGSPAVIRTGAPLLVEEVTDEIVQQAASGPEELALLRQVGYRSMLVVPLRAGEQIIGALGLITTAESGRRYTPADIPLAEELARRAGAALENARLYQSAADAADRVARLQDVTAALGVTMSPDEVASVMVEVGLAAVRADAGALYLLVDEGRVWEALSFRGYPPELAPRHARGPAGGSSPLEEVRATGRVVLIQTPEELVRRWPHLAGAQAKSGDAAIAAVPLLLGQRVLGVLYVAFRSPRRFAPEEVALLEALGRQCAQALDRAQLYAAERAARAAAEEALTLRDGFLSIASHELRTPLTSLLMQTQLLQRRVARGGLLPEREQGALAVVVAQAKRLDRLIAALLDVSRIERGQLTIEVEAVDIGALARRVVAEVQPTSEQHAIACATPASALVISGDPLRLEQVLQNLLQNALKYSPDGGAVDVSVAADGPAAVVEVADRGIGFPPEVLPQLFTRFYRAPNADARNVSGLGIGLYVVREIVRLHGGTVAAALRPDGGSRFTVRLPLATDAPAGDPEIVRGGGADG